MHKHDDATKTKHEICTREYKFFETIGQGSFGKVKRAMCKRTSNTVAIKIIDKRLIGDVEVHARTSACE